MSLRKAGSHVAESEDKTRFSEPSSFQLKRGHEVR